MRAKRGGDESEQQESEKWEAKAMAIVPILADNPREHGV